MLGFTLPILPVQISWINMSTAIFLGMMLIFEAGETSIMQRPHRDPKMPILSMEMFNYALSSGYNEEYVRTVAVNIFVFIELFYLFNCKELQRSVFKTNIFHNLYLLIRVSLMAIVQFSFTHLEFMNTIFKSEPLDFSISSSALFVVEIKRYLESNILKGLKS